MRFLKSEGIIINRLVLKDADRLFTLLTPEQGKILCYAKGVRNIKSSRLTKLNIFSRIRFELVEKQDRRLLTHVDLISSYRQSKTNLANISRLFQIGELINHLLPEDQPQPQIYQLLDTAIANLHRFQTDTYLYRFKLRLLKELGYGGQDLSPQDLDRYLESILERPLRAPTIF